MACCFAPDTQANNPAEGDLVKLMTGPPYFTMFKNLEFNRAPRGVLTLRFHTDGGPATLTGQLHAGFPRALHEMEENRDNRVLQRLAAETAVFPDFPHLTFGSVPGDGTQVVWEKANGFNRTTAADLAYQG